MRGFTDFAWSIFPLCRQHRYHTDVCHVGQDIQRGTVRRKKVPHNSSCSGGCHGQHRLRRGTNHNGISALSLHGTIHERLQYCQKAESEPSGGSPDSKDCFLAAPFFLYSGSIVAEMSKCIRSRSFSVSRSSRVRTVMACSAMSMSRSSQITQR